MRTDENPLVTIALPVFNGARTLRKAMDSLIAQTWPNIEIIICDDVSSDNSVEICREYADRHDHIHFEENPVNLGAWNNVRKHISLARGKYFLWACPDDYWDPEFISELVKPLIADPEAVASMSATHFFYSDFGHFIGRMPESDWPQNNTTGFNVSMCLTKRGQSGRLRKNTYFMYIHGLVRTDIFENSLAVLPEMVSSERQVVSQWALAGRMIWVDKVLYFRESSPLFLPDMTKEQMEEHLDDHELTDYKNRIKISKNIKKDKSSMFPSAWQTVRAWWRSDKIPFRRKLQSLYLIPSYMWYRLVHKIVTLFHIGRGANPVMSEKDLYSKNND